MTGGLLAISTTALAIGVTHTLLGPDHYLPFVALARSRGWSRSRTLVITGICGLGHVLGSIVLGLVGLAAGMVVGRLEAYEAIRGDLAATLLFSFGLAYMLWGLWRFYRPAGHSHALMHRAGIEHAHVHNHDSDQGVKTDDAGDGGSGGSIWIMFIIFVLGPCEPLIPLLMYPASEKNFAAVITVALVFAIGTIGTMLALVALLSAGLSSFRLGGLERASHFLAGAAITLCGAAILFLGL
jgi:nickel/cobalt transporter (NicO) family protein